MTTHPNAELLRDTYRAFDRGDVQPLFDLLSEDVKWVDSTLGPLAGAYSGKAEVPAFFERMMNVYGGSLRVEVVDVIANDDRGVVLTRESGTVDDEPVAWTSVHVWHLRDGHAQSFVSYGSAEYQRFWANKLGVR